MPELFDIIDTNSIELINNIRANMGSAGINATHDTEKSLRREITQEATKIRFQLFGRPFFMSIETGRRPTPDKKPSREMINRIKGWAAARNMDENAAWAIATSIQKKGTELWREGGRKDLVSSPIGKFLNDTSTQLLDALAEDFAINIQQQWSQ